jgi:hypothetical protein
VLVEHYCEPLVKEASQSLTKDVLVMAEELTNHFDEAVMNLRNLFQVVLYLTYAPNASRDLIDEVVKRHQNERKSNIATHVSLEELISERELR